MNNSAKDLTYNNFGSWEKFSNYLWFEDNLKIWLDISKVKFNDKEFSDIKNKFKNVFSALDNLENGAISNIDENRQVGHYWLRNSDISPDLVTKKKY